MRVLAVLVYTGTNEQVHSIEISTRAADHFTRLYYSTYDSPTRAEDLPKFYRATSTLTWNGNPCQGAEGVKKLIQDMPSTKHEVQSYDCHPIPGKHRLWPRYFHAPFIQGHNRLRC